MAQRNALLDGLRMVAALAVLLYHFGFRAYEGGNPQILHYPELAGAAKYGFLGAGLFFFISGYVILMTLRHRTLRDFAVARIVRLYPTFWLCAGMTLVVGNLFGPAQFFRTPVEALANIPILAGAFRAPYIDDVYWSLSMELQFYAVAAALYFTMPARYLAGALVLWVALGTVFIATGEWFDLNVRYPGSTYVGFFGIGAAICFFEHGKRGPDVWCLYAASVAGVVIKLISLANDAVPETGVPVSVPVMVAIMAACAGAVHLAHRVPVSSARAAGWLTFAGGMTYPLYLLHQNIGITLLNRYFDEASRWTGLACVTVFLLLLSAAVYLLFDRPVRSALRRFFRVSRWPAPLGVRG
ncbi:acyltransferase family protein [Cupriavidus sp. IDO]|uniref:acyltransferase family protein n=1 Tax=Cupriavidus sp. IDO TaxID=1539142 RepID=UPI0006916F6B|nr:acyltransferase [Cupriavidus sp. IDO]KWR75032.1 hypothetical protein RM96_35110 [Cupriavidus sp. IDO]